MLPYHAAKYLWMAVNLLAVFASMLLSARVSGVKLRSIGGLLSVTLLLTFHPLLTLLERGQIDGISLGLISMGVFLVSARRHQGVAGVLVAAATILKLHTVLLLPFLLLRRKWRVLAGYTAGVLTMLVLSLTICGPSVLAHYAKFDFPRISTFGESGTSGMLADSSVISSLRPGPGLTVKGGRTYAAERFSFVANATLVRTPVGHLAQEFLSRLNLPSSRSSASLLIFLGFFGLLAFLQRRGLFAALAQPTGDFLYWQLVLVVVLLSAPLTWVMNTVWLVPLLPFAVKGTVTPLPSGRHASLVMLTLGLVAAALPDQRSFRLLLPFMDSIAQYKYVLAELAIAAGLYLHLHAQGTVQQRNRPAVSARAASPLGQHSQPIPNFGRGEKCP
jgi:hypothetical protein